MPESLAHKDTERKCWTIFSLGYSDNRISLNLKTSEMLNARVAAVAIQN